MKQLSFIALLCVGMLLPSAGRAEQVLRLVNTEGKTVRLRVDVAETQAQKAKGLMYRLSVPEGYGMLFMNDDPELMSMWMKNTKVALDVLFFDETGTVIAVEENMRPNDLTPRGPKQLVCGALEVKAGTVRKKGLSGGARIKKWPKAFPCLQQTSVSAK